MLYKLRLNMLNLWPEWLHTKVCKPSSKPGTMLVGSHRPRLGPCHQPLPGRRLQTKVQPAETRQSKEQRKPAHPPSRPRASQGSGNPASIRSHLTGKSQGTQFMRPRPQPRPHRPLRDPSLWHHITPQTKVVSQQHGPARPLGTDGTTVSRAS